MIIAIAMFITFMVTSISLYTYFIKNTITETLGSKYNNKNISNKLEQYREIIDKYYLGEIDDKELITAMNLNSDKKSNIKKPATFSEVLELFLQKGNKKKSVFSQEESKVETLFSKNSPHQDDTL